MISKATHSDLRRHNRQLVLRAVYNGLANNRAALAQETGLAKPTVSELIAELLDEGLLVEEGRGRSTGEGGKPPRLLRLVPASRHVIGICVTEERVLGALAILDGRIVAQHYIDLAGALGEAVIAALVDVVNGLLAQLDAPLLCIGIGVPGVVNAGQGVVSYAPHLGWHNVPLAQRLSEQCGVPVYVATNTELAAMAQFAYGPVNEVNSLATVLVGSSVGVGLVINGTPYYGSDIGYLRMAEYTTEDDDEGRLDSFLGWHSVRQRAYMLRREFPGSRIPGEGESLSYLHLRYAAENGDPAALALRGELSRSLARIFAWIIGLLRPDHISLAGPVANYGQGLLDQAVACTEQLVLPDLLRSVSFSLTEAESAHLVVVGAVAQALQRELGLV